MIQKSPNILVNHFCGDKVDHLKSWLTNEFDIKFAANNWPDANKAYLLGAHLDGYARFLFNSIGITKRSNYEEIVSLLEAGLMTDDRRRFLSDQYDTRTQKTT